MIRKITIETVFINTEKADKTPFIDKNGNPFKMVNISWEGKKASMFCGKYQDKDLEIIKGWSQGDTVEVNLEKKGDYLNFTLPRKTDILDDRMTKVEERLDRLENGPAVEPDIIHTHNENREQQPIEEDSSELPF